MKKTKEVNPQTTTVQGKVLEKKQTKTIVGHITPDNQVIKFNSIEEAKKEAERIASATSKIEYIEKNIKFMESVQKSAINDNSIVVSDDEQDHVAHGILVMPVEILNDIVRHRDSSQYTLIRQPIVVQEFSKFTLKVLANQKEQLELDIVK